MHLLRDEARAEVALRQASGNVIGRDGPEHEPDRPNCQANTPARRPAFKTSRALDFASRKELTAQTGQSVETWPLVILKELVDNGLDIVEEAGGQPTITVAVSTADTPFIRVTDNGPGIPPEVVTNILDFGSRTSSKAAYVSPTRGQQGNALSTILPMPYALAEGEPARKEKDDPDVVIEAHGIAHAISFAVNPIRQALDVSHARSPSPVKNGTRITVRWPASSRSILADAEAQFLQVAEGFAWLNPHLTLTVDWNGQRRRFPAPDAAWPKWRASDATCVHWYRQQDIQRLISAHIVHDGEHGRDQLVSEFIQSFRGLSATAKRRDILDQIDATRAPLRSLVIDGDLDKRRIATLLRAMKAAARPAKPEQLGLIGRDALAKRFEQAGAQPATFHYAKELGVTDGVPWAVECAFAWCPQSAGRQLFTGVNWSPGIAVPFRTLGAYGTSLDTVLANQYVDEDEPVVLVLHLACPRVEYTDRGKSALVTSGPLAEAIRKAVVSVTKKWADQRKREERQASAALNRLDRLRAVKERPVTFKEAARDCMEECYNLVSDNGRLPANARQIMYKARPIIQERTGKKLGDRYFTQTLLPDYLLKHNPDWDVVFDGNRPRRPQRPARRTSGWSRPRRHDVGRSGRALA